MIARDPANDLCLLQAVTITNAPIPLATPNSVATGQIIHCLGYPLEGGIVENVSPVVGSGVIASLRGLRGDPRHLHITVAINPGNSGGPILDQSGRWIAVASHKLADLYSVANTGQVPQGFNFAVKSAHASTLFDSVSEVHMPVLEDSTKYSLEDLARTLSASVFLVIVTH